MALFLTFPLNLGAKPLRVAFVGDPQVNDSTELGYARRSIYRELQGRRDLDLVIILGDLVNDDVRLLSPTKETLDSLSCPWFCVPGNHDRDLYGKKKGKILSIDGTVDENKPRDMASYERIIGKADRWFDVKGLRFILMDDVRRLGKVGYEGGLREDQKVWLREVLTKTPTNQQVIFCTHIPLEAFEAKDSINEILSLHPKMLIVTGHTHSVHRGWYRLSPRDSVEEIIVGATCGSFWRGRKGADGIPNALMNCGAPRGYFIADIRRSGEYRLSWKTVGSDMEAAAWLSGNQLILNIFGGRDDGEAEIRFKDSDGWIKIPHKETVAPEVLSAIEFNKTISGKRPFRNPEYIPLPTYTSSHIWTLYMKRPPESGEKIKLRYRDSSMNFDKTLKVRMTSEALGSYVRNGNFYGD